MPHFRVTLAYDGGDFNGWQRQRDARTVQGVLEEALGRLAGGQRVGVAGAGRTDSGVHAAGQVASFELARPLEPRALVEALNGLLPEDVRVIDAAAVGSAFHARRSARSKLYRYVLDTGAVQLPTRRRYAAHLPLRLADEPVHGLAALYRGERDFAALASSGGSVNTTVRRVLRSEARLTEHGLLYEVEGDGFLRKMVRSLVGGLVAVGQGRLELHELEAALLARDRRAWPPPAPACGLCLVHVDYPSEAGGLE